MAGPSPGGNTAFLSVSTTQVLSTAPTVLNTIVVTTAGSVGAVYDNNSTSTGNTAANLIAVVPAAVGPVSVNWPCKVGVTYVPGAAQVANFSLSKG